MIINNVNGKDYRINFKHEIPKSTSCSIEIVDTGGRFNDSGKTISESKAICDPRDNFDKSVGRKIALRRAMENIGKSERQAIWSGYFSKVSS